MSQLFELWINLPLSNNRLFRSKGRRPLNPDVPISAPVFTIFAETKDLEMGASLFQLLDFVIHSHLFHFLFLFYLFPLFWIALSRSVIHLLCEYARIRRHCLLFRVLIAGSDDLLLMLSHSLFPLMLLQFSHHLKFVIVDLGLIVSSPIEDVGHGSFVAFFEEFWSHESLIAVVTSELALRFHLIINYN